MEKFYLDLWRFANAEESNIIVCFQEFAGSI